MSLDLEKLPKYLRYAAECVKKHTYADHLEFLHAAVIVSGGKVVSIGYNGSRMNSFTREFAVNKHVNSVHAECDAILRARRKINLRGAKIYVARLTRGNRVIANSRPCEMCMCAAKLYGIKRIYYTVDERTYAVVRV